MKKRKNEFPSILTAIVVSLFVIAGCSDDDTKPDPNTVTDIDGNVYKTVQIGDQTWMAENLRVTNYNNGDVIPMGLSNAEWRNTTEGAYAVYNNDNDMLEAYGNLYNGFAVDDARGLCPEGWSVPSDDEWTQLVDYVISQGFLNEWNNPGGAGSALKSCWQVNSPEGGDCNTSEHPRWDADDTHSGFDEFGFSALPGGYRSTDGDFGDIGSNGSWWSSSEYSSENNYGRGIGSYVGSVGRGNASKKNGYSLRCVRNIE